MGEGLGPKLRGVYWCASLAYRRDSVHIDSNIDGAVSEL